MNKGTLEGITVIDLTRVLAGPYCTMFLADMGANVIKVEVPGKGDDTRTYAPSFHGESAYFINLNRNKRSLTLNLKSAKGKQILKDLIKKADILIENFRPGTMEKLGLGYDVLKEVNPKLVYGCISGFGQYGPYHDRPGYDIVAQAMSGMMTITGFPDGPATKIGPSIGDNFSGAHLCMGILMALYEREKTGVGRRVDVAMMDTLFGVLENAVMDYTVLDKIPTRNGNADPAITPFDAFRAKDGDFVMGCGTDKMFAALCQVMGREDLITNPLYVTNDDRCKNYGKGLKNDIEAWTTTKTIDEIEEIIVGLKIPFGRILNVAEAAEHPQIAARNMIWKVYQPEMGKEIKMPGNPIKIHGEDDNIQHCAPALGGDNEAILGTLGYTTEQVAKLREEGVI